MLRCDGQVTGLIVFMARQNSVKKGAIGLPTGPTTIDPNFS
jgi:hypothetical protein